MGGRVPWSFLRKGHDDSKVANMDECEVDGKPNIE